MKIQRPKNTKERGTIECLVYREGDTYIGACLTFDIIEEGSNPTELMRSIREAAELHLETVIRENLSDDLLNRYAPEEYWKKYFETAKQIEKPSLTSSNTLTVSPYYRSLTAQIA
jgi:predicted RNase H-like HicB family nuclease